jgi:hypothetical protein
MFKSRRLTFEELSERLHAYEQKYGYSTIEFYRRFEKGELGDDDDLMMWAGLYHLGINANCLDTPANRAYPRRTGSSIA